MLRTVIDNLLRLLPSFCLISAIKYHTGDKVNVYVNKIGPYGNKHETYHYYQLPLCRPLKVVHKSLSLGQLLDGDRMAESSFLIHFREKVVKSSLCGPYRLTEKDRIDLIAAVEDDFYFELIIDESIRVHNFIGYVEEQNTFPHSHQSFLYTHFTFVIEFSSKNDEIIDIQLQADQGSAIDLTEKPENLELFYSVIWTEADRSKPEDVEDKKFFKARAKRVQWMAILNSIFLVLLLMLVVAWILRSVVKRDLNRYNELTDELALENGWKTISADVFRLPKYRSLFAAIIGVGTQFLFLIALVLLIGSTSLISARRHEALSSVVIFLFAMTSVIAGFISAYMYRQFDGPNWIANANLTSCLFAFPMVLIWILNNSVSWSYGSTQALPYTTVIVLGLLWLCIGYPLTLVGASIGKNFASHYWAPCRTRNIPRQLPCLPLYKSQGCMMLLGGFLPFSAMSVELYYIFSTVWGRETFIINYLLLIVLFITIAVVATSSITLIYFLLSAEDYRWWWASVRIGGSVSILVFIYGIFFYTYRSDMSGLLQTTQYFSHLLLLCYIFFLTMGTVSFFACHRFVQFIYSSVKTD